MARLVDETTDFSKLPKGTKVLWCPSGTLTELRKLDSINGEAMIENQVDTIVDVTCRVIVTTGGFPDPERAVRAALDAFGGDMDSLVNGYRVTGKASDRDGGVICMGNVSGVAKLERAESNQTNNEGCAK